MGGYKTVVGRYGDGSASSLRAVDRAGSPLPVRTAEGDRGDRLLPPK